MIRFVHTQLEELVIIALKVQLACSRSCSQEKALTSEINITQELARRLDLQYIGLFLGSFFSFLKLWLD